MVAVDTFEWRGRSRRVGTYVALGIGLGALYLGLTLDVHALVPALAAIYLALVLARLFLQPTRGFRLNAERLTWFTGMRRHSVRLERVVGVRIGEGLSGETVCAVSLEDGRTVALPGVEGLERMTLMREFGLRGIPISG